MIEETASLSHRRDLAFCNRLLSTPRFAALPAPGVLASAVKTLCSMAGIRDPREFDAWRLSDELRIRIRQVLARPAFASHRSLREQLEKSCESPCPNISEGFSRYLPDDNARIVRIAAGSLSETIEHLDRAHANHIITLQEMTELQTLARRARGAATGLIRYLQNAEAPHLPPR